MDSVIYLDRAKKRTIGFEAQISQIQKPVLRIEFHTLLSWNNLLGMARHSGAVQGMLKTWRNKGFDKAIIQGNHQGFELSQWTEHITSDKGKVSQVVHKKFKSLIFTEPAIIILRYWRPTFAVYDTFSPFIKPIIDGFTDAGIFADDSQFDVIETRTKFMGIDETLKPSEFAKADRKIKRLSNKKSLPQAARYWFDFYKASEIES